MLQENTIFIIRVPDPEDVASLNQLVAAIEDEPIVLLANKSVIVEDQEPVYDSYLPIGIQEIPGHISQYNGIDNHLAARAHAAWNLRGAITRLNNRPWIVIGDFFGDGAPGRGYNASFTKTDFATGNIDSHGYHVLGIITGIYDTDNRLSSPQNHVTGIFPERLRVRAVDLKGDGTSTLPQVLNLLRIRINEIIDGYSQARIIVTTSLGVSQIGDHTRYALSWIMRVRGVEERGIIGAGLESRLIHFTSAGNISYDADGNIIRWPAHENSMFAYAALRDVVHGGIEVPKLSNTFVIENRVNTLHHESDTLRQRPLPGCADNSSIMGGNLSAMGTKVWSFGECLNRDQDNRCILHASDPHTSFMSGTSMATPQAAGVAAYVWSVNPNLSVSEVMKIIRDTAENRVTTTLRPDDDEIQCNTVIPQPVVDAYAAVLAAGGEKIRIELLDVTGNGNFDHNDIEEFLEIYLDTLKARLLDYSRYDLNGDGITGGSYTDRFDLTMDGQYSEVQKTIEGTLITFDENNLTDLEILCYYAYSNIYRGDPYKRNELLKNVCHCPPTIHFHGVDYKTAHIGGQCWMAENLRTMNYRNGDFIPNVIPSVPIDTLWRRLNIGAWVYYNNNPSNDIMYGKLYNWFAVADPRGLCPAGWHVPTMYEWDILMRYLGYPNEKEGGKMKSTRTYPDPHPRWDSPNFGATNESGWSGLPGGNITSEGIYNFIGSSGLWWSSTAFNIINAWYVRLDYNSDTALAAYPQKRNGMSVRCLKD